MADDTGSHFTTFFQQQGEQLVNLSAEDFGRIYDNREIDDKDYDRVMQVPLFKEFVLANR